MFMTKDKTFLGGTAHAANESEEQCGEVSATPHEHSIILPTSAGMQELHIGDKHIHTVGPVYNSPVVMNNPVLVVKRESTLLPEYEETSVKLPILSAQEHQASSSSDNTSTHDICEKLKSSLREKVKAIASEESSLAEFSQRPIPPVDLSIISQPQRIDDAISSIEPTEKHTDEKGSVASSTEGGQAISVEQLFEQADKRATAEACQKIPACDAEARREYVEKHGNVAGVIGPTGVGKTTLSKKWASQALRGELFGGVTFIFYIVVRFIAFKEKLTLLQFLLSTMLPDWTCVPEVGKDILKVIADDRNVLIIFDGLDKADFKSFSGPVPLPPLHSKSKPEQFLKHLANGNILPRSRKIFTSRPAQMYRLHPSHRPKFIVQIIGLTRRSQDELGRQICGSEYCRVQDRLSLNPNMQAFCRIPANYVLTLNYLMNTSGHIEPVSLARVLTFTCCQYLRTEHLKSEERRFGELSLLAWNGLLNKKLVFFPDDFEKLRIRVRSVDDFLVTSVTKRANLKHQILSHDKCCHFTHLIWQEYFAAVYLMLLMPLKDFRKHYKQLCEQYRWEVVVKLALGIREASTLHELKHFVAGCRLEKLNDKFHLIKEHIFQCFSQQTRDDMAKRVLSWTREANDPEITSGVSDLLTHRIERSFAGLLPTDVENLSFVLQAKRSNKVLKLNLSWNKVGLLGATSLTKCLHNITNLILCHCDMDCRAVEKLSTAIGILHDSIVVLDLSWNNLGDDGAHHLANCVHKIRVLILCHTYIGTDGTKRLAEKVAGLATPMKRLTLSANAVGDEGAFSLANCAYNLGMLELVECDVGDQGALKLAEKLQTQPTQMRKLILSNNSRMTDKCLDSLLRCSKHIKVLKINCCAFSADAKKCVTKKSYPNVFI